MLAVKNNQLVIFTVSEVSVMKVRLHFITHHVTRFQPITNLIVSRQKC